MIQLHNNFIYNFIMRSINSGCSKKNLASFLNLLGIEFFQSKNRELATACFYYADILGNESALKNLISSCC